MNKMKRDLIQSAKVLDFSEDTPALTSLGLVSLDPSLNIKPFAQRLLDTFARLGQPVRLLDPRKADRVLLIGTHDGNPRMSVVEEDLDRDAVGRALPRELVLLKARVDTLPRHTGAWLKNRRVRGYHHVHPQSDGDLERLVRRLTGKAISLVLSGGGARGFAQIGVLRALEEEQVPIDLIGGTSMGAFVGALYTIGWRPDNLMDICKDVWTKSTPIRNLTIPRVSLCSSSRLERAFHDIFGQLRIENLNRAYFCMSSNLTRVRSTLHRKGLLHRCVLASLSIPGLLPPVVHKGELLVDGGLMDNLPVGPMRQLNGGPLIAIDISPRQELRVREKPATGMIGRIREKFGIAPATTHPSMLDILDRTAMLASLKRIEKTKHQIDLYLRPAVEHFDLFAWKSIQELHDIGYEHAKNRIALWRGR